MISRIGAVALLSLTTAYFCIAQINYNADNIPAELKENAKAVVRIENNTLELLNEGKAKLKITEAITILNENGIDLALFRQYYDKFLKISIGSAIVYDATGKKVKSIPGSEIYDFSANTGASGYDDNRVKLIDPEYRKYPFTVEYSYELVYNGTLQLPTWSPYKAYDIAVQHSEMKVIVPAGMEIRYYERNLTTPLKFNSSDKGKTYMWEANNLKALKEEPFSGPMTDYLPVVYLGMNSFSLGGIKGDASTWTSFGKWMYDLNAGRNVLPESTKQKLAMLVSNVNTESEKVKILYEYMQKNTRYVSVQMGIGGLQSFEAEKVDRLGYGDCKALSNYMQSILNSVGIEAYYTIVMAGEDAPDVLKDFPSIQFNHVIVCVPNKGDTIWLECTNQNMPCGYIGTFTDDRNVLVIKEDGGHLVRTRSYSADENLKSTLALINLTAEGKGSVKITNSYSGIYYDMLQPILRSDDADRKKLMYKSIDIPHFTLNTYSHKEHKDQIPRIEESIDLELGNYVTVMGSNMFFELNLMNKVGNSPKKLKIRLSDIYFDRPYSETDTVIYTFPEGYTIGGLPDKVVLANKYWKYSAESYMKDGKLVYVRNFKLNNGIYPKEEYPEIIQCFDQVVKADQQKVSLKKL